MVRQRKRKGRDWTGHAFAHGVVAKEHSVGFWEVQCRHCSEVHIYETRSVRNESHTKKCKAFKPHNKLYGDRYDGVLRRTYNLTLEEYNSMYEQQDGLCAICGKPDEVNGRRLAVDHDHDTEEVRALLCGNCNRGLGNFKDDYVLLSKAAQYLNKYANAR